jgi:hypothetical protein
MSLIWALSISLDSTFISLKNSHYFHETRICVLLQALKGLSHEIDFKTFDKNLQNLA